MIQFDCFDSRRIERNRIVQFRLVEKILFIDEEKLGLWINESLDQPGASNTIDSYVLSCNPLHADILFGSHSPPQAVKDDTGSTGRKN
jgi:hypothetical protein